MELVIPIRKEKESIIHTINVGA